MLPAIARELIGIFESLMVWVAVACMTAPIVYTTYLIQERNNVDK